MTVIGGADSVSLQVTTSDARCSYREGVSSVDDRTPMHAKQDVVKLVDDAIEAELKARGFRIQALIENSAASVPTS
ncbi:MAG: YajG family lipoprotein [Pseudomonadota bacterium]